MKINVWQSWSHTKKNIFRLPLWDYCPVKQIAPENKKPKNFKLKPPISGWCSWHSFGKKISHQLILNQAHKAKKNKLEYILIDDGWCQWGDWQNPITKKFPKGINGLSADLKNLKLKTGLWLAPFLIDPKSQIYKEHPNWVVKNHHNKPVNGWKFFPFNGILGFNKYILNFEIPEARKYILASLEKSILDWKVDLLKLDFLYAPYFNPKYTTDEKPHSFLIDIFRFLKINFPNVYIVACGCPYKPAKYLVDAIRISADINSPFFQSIPIINWLIYKNRLRNLLSNWESHQHLKQYFHLDPDAILYNQSLDCYQKSHIRFVGSRL